MGISGFLRRKKMNEFTIEGSLKDRSVPFYYQIVKLLRRKIEQGELTPGEKLPPEMELSKSFGVSRVTLRQALSILDADGLLNRERGRGTYVTKTPANPKKIKLTGIIGQGFPNEEKHRLLSVEDVSPPSHVEQFFGLSGQGRLTRIRRLRLEKKTPYCFTMNYLPVDLAKKVTHDDILNQSMLNIIKKRFRHPVGKINQTFEARTADNEVAEHLLIGILDPVLYVETFVYGTDGKGIEFSQIYYRGNQHLYSIELLSNGKFINSAHP
jgi:GntR family transcriptional regulator